MPFAVGFCRLWPIARLQCKSRQHNACHMKGNCALSCTTLYACAIIRSARRWSTVKTLLYTKRKTRTSYINKTDSDIINRKKRDTCRTEHNTNKRKERDTKSEELELYIRPKHSRYNRTRQQAKTVVKNSTGRDTNPGTQISNHLYS